MKVNGFAQVTFVYCKNFLSFRNQLHCVPYSPSLQETLKVIAETEWLYPSLHIFGGQNLNFRKRWLFQISCR